VVSHRRRRFDLALVVLTMVAATACAAVPPGPIRAPPTITTLPPRPDSFSVVATGDVLIHQDRTMVGAAAAAGRANGTGFDFTSVLTEVAPTIRAADLAICHLETPVAPPGGPFRGYPAFSVQPQILDALAGAGYDTCATASNHSLDAGFDGVVRTLDALDRLGMGHTGTFRNEQEHRTPHISTVAGVKVADIAWTYGLNGYRETDPWVVNDFDPVEPRIDGMLADAARARRAHADVVIASVHCCTEYTHEPTRTQLAIAAALLASPDVDLVIGHHAHVVQPFERINGKWVAYGLGNHIAEQSPEPTRDSVIARFTFTRGPDGRFGVTSAEAIPTRIQRQGEGLAVVRTHPGDPSYDRVAEVVARRGGTGSGLIVTSG
jgi:poly-gamma-glutamate capsule biosynthesis protein CapA/YwtB (metallophosphatase superfamily)